MPAYCKNKNAFILLLLDGSDYLAHTLDLRFQTSKALISHVVCCGLVAHTVGGNHRPDWLVRILTENTRRIRMVVGARPVNYIDNNKVDRANCKVIQGYL